MVFLSSSGSGRVGRLRARVVRLRTGSGSPGRPRLFRSPSSRVSGKDLCHAAASPTPAFSAAAIAAVPASGSVTRRSRDAARLARGTLWCPSQLDCSLALPSLCSASALAAAALVRPAPCSGYVHVVPRPRARQLLFWVTDGTAVVCLVNAAVL
jgi:hypothetical protein